MAVPWDDCKIAFGLDDDAPFDDAIIFENMRQGVGLPSGCVLDAVDGTGARWVAVFRVAGIPAVSDGEHVRSVLRTVGAIASPDSPRAARAQGRR